MIRIHVSTRDDIQSGAMGGDDIVYIDGPTSRRPVTNPIFNVFSLACRRSFILSNIERVDRHFP